MNKMRTALLLLVFLCVSCRPVPGPDKSVVGATLGTGWGAGVGAVLGNQFSATPEGIAIGAGFGLASGLITGIGVDHGESIALQQQLELDEMRLLVLSNEQSLLALQEKLDNREQNLGLTATGSQVFFDSEEAMLRSGSAQQLERIVNSIKVNPYFGRIEVHGHSDKSDNSDKDNRVAEARAKTVATFLINQGLSLDQIRVLNHGSKRPLASNATEAGRQLNRRVEVVLLK